MRADKSILSKLLTMFFLLFQPAIRIIPIHLPDGVPDYLSCGRNTVQKYYVAPTSTLDAMHLISAESIGGLLAAVRWIPGAYQSQFVQLSPSDHAIRSQTLPLSGNS